MRAKWTQSESIRPLMLIAGRCEARLARCERLPNGRVHVDIVASTVESWDPLHHANPPSRSDSAGHMFDNSGHQEAERLHRFAREIVSWLGRTLPQHGGQLVAMAAEPAMLGALRTEAPPRMTRTWIEHRVDLAGLHAGELAQRTEVLELLI